MGCTPLRGLPAARPANPDKTLHHPLHHPHLPAHPRSLPAFAKVHSILTNVSEELPDAPLYLSLHDVCKTLRCSVPRTDTFKSALANAGYR